jgi:hypothetical protein
VHTLRDAVSRGARSRTNRRGIAGDSRVTPRLVRALRWGAAEVHSNMKNKKSVKLIVKSGVKAGFNPQPDPPGRHGIVETNP